MNTLVNIEDDKKMQIFLKPVNDKDVRFINKFRTIDKESINQVLLKILESGKTKPYNFFELSENVIDWINEIFYNFNINDERLAKNGKYLLNDFSDSMNTRMREKDKWAIAIVKDDSLLLCQTKSGEHTITKDLEGPYIDNNVSSAERLLDTDNIERYACFYYSNKEITKITFYEKSKSEFFSKWLGIQSKDANYLYSGENRFHFKLLGLSAVLEISDSDIENKFIKPNDYFEFKNNNLHLNNPISEIQISSIKVGKRNYSSYKKFEQDFLAKRHELAYFQGKYRTFLETVDLLLFHKYLDKADSVVFIDKGEEQVFLNKSNTNFHIFFNGPIYPKDEQSSSIELDQEYLDLIISRIKNNQRIRVFHAAMELNQSADYFRFGPLEFYNPINKTEIIESINRYLSDTELSDKILNNIIFYSGLCLLKDENRDTHIFSLLESIVNSINTYIEIPKKISNNENSNVEYKSRSVLEKTDAEIIAYLQEDIPKKILQSERIIYFFGVEDKSRAVLPLDSRKFNTERLGKLETEISKIIKKTIKMIKYELDEKTCIISLYAYGN